MLLSTASASSSEPTGFGKAPFGSSPAQVQRLYPGMKELHEGLGAAVVKGPYISRFVIRGASVPGLKSPVDVELRFWEKRLWVVIVYFGANDLKAVSAALTGRFGPPTTGKGSPAWIGKKSTIIVASRAKWYSMHDNRIAAEAQKVFVADFRRSVARAAGARSRAAAGVTPDAGPSSGTPAETPAVR